MNPSIEIVSGQKVFFYDIVDSTMDIAHNLAKAGERGIVVAATQRAGRATGNKCWESPSGGLYLTWIFEYEPHEQRTEILYLGVALAIINALEAFGLKKCKIKLPNDVFFGNQKIAGILEEIMPYGHLIGMGVNLNASSEKITSQAITYQDATGKPIDITDFLSTFIEKVEWLKVNYALDKKHLIAQWQRALLKPTAYPL